MSSVNLPVSKLVKLPNEIFPLITIFLKFHDMFNLIECLLFSKYYRLTLFKISDIFFDLDKKIIFDRKTHFLASLFLFVSSNQHKLYDSFLIDADAIFDYIDSTLIKNKNRTDKRAMKRAINKFCCFFADKLNNMQFRTEDLFILNATSNLSMRVVYHLLRTNAKNINNIENCIVPLYFQNCGSLRKPLKLSRFKFPIKLKIIDSFVNVKNNVVLCVYFNLNQSAMYNLFSNKVENIIDNISFMTNERIDLVIMSRYLSYDMILKLERRLAQYNFTHGNNHKYYTITFRYVYCYKLTYEGIKFMDKYDDSLHFKNGQYFEIGSFFEYSLSKNRTELFSLVTRQSIRNLFNNDNIFFEYDSSDNSLPDDEMLWSNDNGQSFREKIMITTEEMDFFDTVFGECVYDDFFSSLRKLNHEQVVSNLLKNPEIKSGELCMRLNSELVSDVLSGSFYNYRNVQEILDCIIYVSQNGKSFYDLGYGIGNFEYNNNPKTKILEKYRHKSKQEFLSILAKLKGEKVTLCYDKISREKMERIISANDVYNQLDYHDYYKTQLKLDKGKLLWYFINHKCEVMIRKTIYGLFVVELSHDVNYYIRFSLPSKCNKLCNCFYKYSDYGNIRHHPSIFLKKGVTYLLFVNDNYFVCEDFVEKLIKKLYIINFNHLNCIVSDIIGSM